MGGMTPQLDLSTWPAKPEAARLLGIGERTLDRQIKRTGAPEVRRRPRCDGRKPEPVCNPEDLARLLEARKRAVAVSSGGAADVTPVMALARSVDDGPAIARVLEAVASISRPIAGKVAVLPLYLTLKQASGYSGLSMALLQRLASAGGVLAVKDNGWKIQRAALDELGKNLVAFLESGQ